MPTPLTTADLIFSEQANHNFSRTLGDLRRSAHSIRNRLASVLEDAAFVQEVARAYNGRPLVANERCGSWYVDPERKAASAYFKSTDGHAGVWTFSTRRLNLHLLDLVGEHDGCIIVDSTRRGKRMPDALSKTVPIWCAVLNLALFPDRPDAHGLHTPPSAVSPSEHAQICARLPALASSFRSLGVDPAALRRRLRGEKPLRPVWVTPESHVVIASAAAGAGAGAGARVFADFRPVICCTASRMASAGSGGGGGYVQGSGDDTENWARGLTPRLFWQNRRRLLGATSEAEIEGVIAELVAAGGEGAAGPAGGGDVAPPRLVVPTRSLFVGLLPEGPAAGSCGSGALAVNLHEGATAQATWRTAPQVLDVGIGTSKIASRNLRTALPLIAAMIGERVQGGDTDEDVAESAIYIACSSGKDISVGVALAILCQFYNDQGVLVRSQSVRADLRKQIDKAVIRRKLSWIMTSMPDVNPSRTTLQSVNSFLIDRP